MGAWLRSVLIALGCLVTLERSHRARGQTSAKKMNVLRFEDYTFEGVLDRAREECSYMALVNDTVVRNRTLHAVKEKIARKKLNEFYRQKEVEKQKAKEFYEKVEKQSRRKALEGPRRGPSPPRPLPPPRPRPPPPPPPNLPFPPPPRPRPGFPVLLPPRPPPDLPPPLPPRLPPPPFPRRNLYKRSPEFHGRRGKAPASFSEVSFTDHNNCTSRCLFARMEMVDLYGFPDESLITKLIQDKIMNTKFRLLKMKKVRSCFRKMEEVAFDDSCIFSSRLFDCLDLGEPYSWTGA